VLHFKPETCLYPSIFLGNVIPADRKLWMSHEITPSYISMFDDMFALQASKVHEVDESPMSCTIWCRKLTVACSIAFSRRRHLNMLSGTFRDPHDVPRFEFGRHENFLQEKYWKSQWCSRTFESLVSAKFCIQKYQQEIAWNISALGMDPTAMSKALAPEKDWERVAWKEVQEWCALLLHMVDHFMQTHSQQATIHEAQKSNSIAKSVGKLTALASLFFPISVVAGIFSMGGNFLPGENLFWVFWAVVGPLCLVAGVYTFRTYCSYAARAYYEDNCNGLARKIWPRSPQRLPR